MEPAVSVTCWSPSSPEAIKSEPATSVTVSSTVKSAVGALSAVTVNTAFPPSVTAAIGPEMLNAGTSSSSSSSSSSTVTVTEPVTLP